MIACVTNFLNKHWDQKSSLLLGYSGGPDSKALLYALLESGCKDFLHVAHVDHGWRKESADEALELQEEIFGLGLPFHLHRLEPVSGNQEMQARKKRLLFFQGLFQNIPFQALLLAHHADDLAETVLKRIFEGAHLSSLGAMASCSQMEGMAIWRPLLSIKKQEMLALLEEREMQPLIDKTNFDSRFLRSRMRMHMLPYLSDLFGKEITQNLRLLSSRAWELKEYLNQKTVKRLPEVGPWGLFGFLADLEKIEARHLLMTWAERYQLVIPRSVLEQMLDQIFLQLPNRKIRERIFVDRGYVFFLSAIPPCFGEGTLLLQKGSFRLGDWEITIDEGGLISNSGLDPCSDSSSNPGWKSVWSGHFSVSSPKGWLRMPQAKDRLRGFWNAKRVPAFFRSKVPVVEGEGCGVKDFLSEKSFPTKDSFFEMQFNYLSTSEIEIRQTK